MPSWVSYERLISGQLHLREEGTLVSEKMYRSRNTERQAQCVNPVILTAVYHNTTLSNYTEEEILNFCFAAG